MKNRDLILQVVNKFCPAALEGFSDEERGERVEKWCTDHDCAFVSLREAGSDLLREMPDPPLGLFCIGDKSLLRSECISIVGTRDASGYGLRASVSFAKYLALRGFTIVSGLAKGIDRAAHQGALLARGKTIAVLGHGLDQVYPRQNVSLAREITESGGLLVSEYPPWVPPAPYHFPARNRIVSALAWGTIVIEAREKSGSLITAQLALDQNREVFVVPGRYDDTNFSGGLRLAQNGAKIVFHPDHVLEECPMHIALPMLQVELDFGQHEKLRRVFEKVGGMGSLSQIYSLWDEESEALSASLDAAVKDGMICEISHQFFVWIESEKLQCFAAQN